MQIWAETVKSALPIHNYSQILYQFLTFTQNLKWSRTVERCTIFGGSFRYYILYFIQTIILYIGLNNTIVFFKTRYIIIWQFTPTVFS